MPIFTSPSNRLGTACSSSLYTRSQIFPTVCHSMRISSNTVFLEAWVESQVTVSSKFLQNRDYALPKELLLRPRRVPCSVLSVGTIQYRSSRHLHPDISSGVFPVRYHIRKPSCGRCHTGIAPALSDGLLLPMH